MENPQMWAISSDPVTLRALEAVCDIVTLDIGGSFETFGNASKAIESSSNPDAVLLYFDFNDDVQKFRERVSKIRKKRPNALFIAVDSDFDHEPEVRGVVDLFIAPGSMNQPAGIPWEGIIDLLKNTERA